MSEQPPGRSLCPSAQPEWQGSVAFGVVRGTAEEPRVTNYPEVLPVTEDLLKLAQPVHPTEVFRFAAPCLCHGCVHFKIDRCSLVERIVRILPEVVRSLPSCAIRSHCRWWQQEGANACFRCPQVVTENHNPSTLMRKAAAVTQVARGEPVSRGCQSQSASL